MTIQANPASLVISRVFDAPIALVWKAWTDPEQVMKWWGPAGFTSPACRMDLRVGGKYMYCMRSPEGEDGWNGGVFKEIEPMKRIVATVSFMDEQGTVLPPAQFGMVDWPDEALATTTFEERDGKTTLTLQYDGIPADDMRGMMIEGWNQSLDKLAATLR